MVTSEHPTDFKCTFVPLESNFPFVPFLNPFCTFYECIFVFARVFLNVDVVGFIVILILVLYWS